MTTLPMAIKSLIRRALPRRSAATTGGPLISCPDWTFGISGASIDPTARLYVLPDPTLPSPNFISLGDGVYVGRHAEVTAGRGNVEIDNDTSLQDFSVIYGDVRIGAHCLFAMHAFVTSTSYRFRDRAEWLIRDQDEHFGRFPTEAVDPPSRRVRIEDDCWFGWSAVVLPGVYIGRGAVIGAHCVVTSDIAPYEIHGGVPNRKLSERLSFRPPARIEAVEDASIPYFYRGFILKKSALERSRATEIVEMRRKACIVLAGTDAARVRLTGRQSTTASERRLRVSVNGGSIGHHVLGAGSFEIVAGADNSGDGNDGAAIPSALKSYTYVELETESTSDDRPGLGISSAELC